MHAPMSPRSKSRSALKKKVRLVKSNCEMM